MEQTFLLVGKNGQERHEFISFDLVDWISKPSVEHVVETGSSAIILVLTIVLIRSLTALIKASK